MNESLKVIAGLGNPGSEYEDTRHNAGFWFVDALARQAGSQFNHEKRFDAEVCRIRIAGEQIWLLKPQRYMNDSGRPVRSFIDYYRVAPNQVLVAHDEIDLPPGTVRLKHGGGHGGHNGLRDVVAHAGKDFLRLRLGVGHPGSKDKVVGYVLKRAAENEKTEILATLDRAVDVLPILIEDGVQAAMKHLNTKAGG